MSKKPSKSAPDKEAGKRKVLKLNKLTVKDLSAPDPLIHKVRGGRPPPP
jgi:hypothetical protein